MSYGGSHARTGASWGTHRSCPTTAGLHPHFEPGWCCLRRSWHGSEVELILMGNARFTKLWDAGTCLPWSCCVGLRDPCSTARGGGMCPCVVSGGAGFVFPSQAQRALPFSAVPLQREGWVGVFFLSASSASLFPAFLSHEVCLSLAPLGAHVARQLESTQPGPWKRSCLRCLERCPFQPPCYRFMLSFSPN